MSLENTHDIGNIKIVMLGGSGGATALSDLTDTNISNPASGQVLKYNGLKWANGDIVSGLGIGKKTSVSNNTIITDIDLHREPIAGDRLLLYFDTTVQNPTGLTTYNNGTAVTKNLENVSPLYYNAGWNVAEFKNDGLLYNNVWVRVQNVPVINYNAGSGISISNNTIVNTRRGALTGAIDSISSGYAHVLMNGARDTFAAGALIVVQSEASGSATNLRIQYGSQASDSQDFRFYDTEGDTLSLSISSGNTIIAMIDSTGYRAIVLKVLDIEAQVGEPVRELRKLKIDGVVYDTDGMRTYEAANVANNNITLSVLNAFQFVQKVIAINTGAHSGSSSAWNLVISDGMEVASVALKNADGTAFADDIHENELLFVYVDTAGNVARVLEIHSHDLEILKDAIITEKTVSGNPITVTDALPYNAVSLSTEIEAEQDLHGYDHPWVGGAGKNKCNYDSTSITIDKNFTTTIIGTFVSSIATSVIVSRKQSLTITSAQRNTIYLKNKSTGTIYYATNTATDMALNSGYHEGLIENIPAGTYDVIVWAQAISDTYILTEPMIRDSNDTSTTWEPYSNICPISGKTAVGIDQTGNAITFAQGGLQDNNGAEVASDARIRSDYIPYTNGEFTLSMVSGAENDDRLRNSIYLYDAQKQFIAVRQYGLNPSAFPVDVDIDIPANTAYMRFVVQKENTSANISPTNKIMAIDNINVVIQLGQTVYGGSLNVTTGVLTVTHAIIDLGTLTYGKAGTDNKAFSTNSIKNEIKPCAWSSEITTAICSQYSADTGSNVYTLKTDGTFGVDANGQIYFYDSRFEAETAENIKTALSGVQFVYELKTPTTIQLTPEQLTMLKGYNRLSCDGGGDITLTYRADRLAAIEAALAALQ